MVWSARDLEDLIVALGLDEVIDLEVLLCPDEVAAELVHQDFFGPGDGVEVRDVFVGTNLSLRDNRLRLDRALARHKVDVVATEAALTDAHTRAIFHIDVGLVEVGLHAEGYFSLYLYEEAAAYVGEGGGVVPEGLVDSVQDVANLLLEVHVVLYDMQLGVSRPSLEDAGIEVAGLLHRLVARGVVL